MLARRTALACGPGREGYPAAVPVLETSFLLIRHAESTWNAQGRWQGHGDPDLSARGRVQAQRLARELGREPVDLVIASDLVRARQTARLIAEARGLEPRLESFLRELDVGEWTGLTRDEIAARASHTLERFEAGDVDARPGGGESRREIRLRVRRAVASLAEEQTGRSVALVTHLGVIRALLPGSEFAHVEWRRVRAADLVS